METKPKNRAWVKDAAIVFLVVLLLLTFFSNTIMNHSLPEVATVMVSNGTITAKVRGTGTVSANGDHKVKAKSGFTIGKVMVKAGQEVNAGDVLFVLGAGDSDELEEAKIALEDLQVQYSQAALSVPLADAFVDERNALTKAENAYKKASQELEQLQKEIDNGIGQSEKAQNLLKEKDSVEKELAATTKQLDELKLPLESLEKAMNEAKATYTDLNTKYLQQQDEAKAAAEAEAEAAKKAAEEEAAKKAAEEAAKKAAEEEAAKKAAEEAAKQANAEAQSLQEGELSGAPTVGTQASEGVVATPVTEAEVIAAEAKYKELENEYNTQLNSNATKINSLQYKVDTLALKLKAINSELEIYSGDYANLEAKRQAVNDAQAEYYSKMDALNRAAAQQERSIASASVGLTSISNQIKRQQDKIKKLSGEGDENTVTANVSGTITEVNCTAGDTVVKDDILASIEVPDQGYTVSFSVTNDQAKRLRIGDTATISNYYWGNKIVATLSGIQTDKKNPMTNKTLTFDLEGDVTSGSEITVSVGQKSANYDIIIPNSAIRTDSNGSFVLAVTAKNSPLGNRYIAKRVAIEVLAADDNNSAVTADLSNGDYVITTSSAPIATGDMVRLANEEN